MNYLIKLRYYLALGFTPDINVWGVTFTGPGRRDRVLFLDGSVNRVDTDGITSFDNWELETAQ